MTMPERAGAARLVAGCWGRLVSPVCPTTMLSLTAATAGSVAPSAPTTTGRGGGGSGAEGNMLILYHVKLRYV